MSITPVFDQTVAASDADLWKASHIFPVPTDKPAGWPSPSLSLLDQIQWAMAFEAEAQRSKTKPEPTWRTFLRCLFWWLP